MRRITLIDIVNLVAWTVVATVQIGVATMRPSGLNIAAAVFGLLTFVFTTLLITSKIKD